MEAPDPSAVGRIARARSAISPNDAAARRLRAGGGSVYHEAYCSADCTQVSCPEAWERVATASSGPMVCAKQVAVFADITPQSFRAHVAVTGSRPYAELEIVVPRTIGVVDTSSSSPFQVKNMGGMREPQAGPPKIEVLEAGTDGRSYRVKLTLDTVWKPTCTFVATLP